MLRKTVEFATPGTKLSVANKQLVIDRPNMAKTTLPIEDLGVVIVDDRCATYTQAVLIDLLAAGATLLVTGRDHLPLGMMLPLDAHHAQTERHRAQVEATQPTRKRVWQTLVRAKIVQQGRVIEFYGGSAAGYVAMARRVRSGDPDNIEAQAAQRYWPQLFGAEFRRDRQAADVNALLNYGYAVLRAAAARSLVAAGLIPSLGVYHRNRGNPFCLADDLLEPYRPYVDWRTKQLTMRCAGARPDTSDRQVRAELLSLFNETIVVGGRRTPLLLGVQTSAASLCRALTGEGTRLALPQGMPVEPEVLEAEAEV